MPVASKAFSMILLIQRSGATGYGPEVIGARLSKRLSKRPSLWPDSSPNSDRKFTMIPLLALYTTSQTAMSSATMPGGEASPVLSPRCATRVSRRRQGAGDRGGTIRGGGPE